MKFPLRPGEANSQLSTLQRHSTFSSQPQALGASLQLVPGGHIKVGQSNYNVGTGFWLGLDSGVPKLSLRVSTGNNLTWDGDSLDITGTLTATSGTIGGFTLGSTTLTATNLTLDSSGQRITLGSSNDIVILDADDGTYRLWIGNATAASAPFSVTKAGAVTASNITITGGSVVTSVLSGLVALANQNIATQGWTQTSAFSVSDADTVAWGAGTFTTAGGTSYSIGAGNTGNMAARTYIYLDIGVSTTAYQTTTTASTAVGAGKVLVAVAQNGTVEPTFTVLDGTAQNINASSIVADSITGNEIAASTIEAGHLSVSSLSAIAADLGTITAGTIALASSGHIRAGQTAYNTGTGFFLGFDGATPKFSLGNSAGTNLTWDGSILNIVGTLNIDSGSTDSTLTSTQLKLSSSANVSFYAENTSTGTSTVQLITAHGGGDPYILFDIAAGSNDWTIGVDNSASDVFKISRSVNLGTNDALIINGSNNVTLGGALTTSAPTGGAGAWELGIANAVSPTSPNRTLTVEIGGTAYYIHAKTTND
jgi:fibronectin-binding autotransporter adhesin